MKPDKSNKMVVDPVHSGMELKVRHLMIASDASIYTTGKDFSTAEVDLWIDATSINTGSEQCDKHLTRAISWMPLIIHK